jgi:hypothetical protein
MLHESKGMYMGKGTMVDIKGKIMEGKHREKMFALHFYDGVC